MIAGIGGSNYDPELAGTASESTHSRRFRDAEPSVAIAANQLDRTDGVMSRDVLHSLGESGGHPQRGTDRAAGRSG